METGYSKHTLVFEVDVNEDNLLSQLMKIREMASNLSWEANNLIRQLQQAKKAEADSPQPED